MNTSTSLLQWLKTLYKHTVVRFIIAGSINTVIAYLLYLAFLTVATYNVAYTLSFMLSVIVSYLLNLFFVFRTKISLKTSLQFPLVYVFQFALGVSTLNFLINVLHIRPQIAPLLVVIISTPITYVLIRLVLTKKHKVLPTSECD
ncbi:MAG: GtrA family protein [Legionellaceae bacterium]|nr:GtrA family protein [Legionellaceae bacterium]